MQNPLSTEALVTWLKKQPSKGTYDFQRIDSCLLQQYFTAAGFPHVQVEYGRWSQGRWDSTDFKVRDIPDGWEQVAHGGRHSWSTYGAALKRAEALLATKPKRTAKKRVAA